MSALIFVAVMILIALAINRAGTDCERERANYGCKGKRCECQEEQV